MPEPNDPAVKGTAPIAGDPTYTILLSAFRAPVIPPAGGPVEAADLALELTVLHPGPGFADDIAAVMSYEDIVQDVRTLCARTEAEDPQRLADAAVAAALGFPRVIAATATVRTGVEPETAAVARASRGSD